MSNLWPNQPKGLFKGLSMSIKFKQHYPDGSEINSVICNGICFHILVSPANLRANQSEHGVNTQGLETEYLRLQAASCEFEDNEEEPCLPIFRQKAPQKPELDVLTLQQFLHPPTFWIKLQNKNGRLEAILTAPNPSLLKAPTCDYVTTLNTDPRYIKIPRTRASAIQVLPPKGHDIHIIFPKKVLIQGVKGDSLFKLVHSVKKIDTFVRIQEARLPENIRVTRLHSLVVTDDGSLVGMLLNYVDSEPYYICGPDGDRQKWFDQIKKIVELLHRAGICWGNVHPRSVAVDKNDNAWIVDFDGGSEVTMESDLRGLVKLETAFHRRIMEVDK